MLLGLGLSLCAIRQGHEGVPTYEWTQKTATASWLARDGAELIPFLGKLWIFGGWDSGLSAPGQGGATINPGRPTCNQVLSSSDQGATWVEELAHVESPPQTGAGARWYRRHSHRCFPHTHAGTEYIYLVGGDHLIPGADPFGAGASNGYQCDVWRSSNPGNANGWERVAESDSVGWTGRMLTMPVSHGGALYVMGGQNGLIGGPPYPFTSALTPTFYNDVWKSTDGGATWTRILANAPWSSRGVTKAVSHNGRIWVIGGGHYPTGTAEPGGPSYVTSNPRTFFAEVWSSADGITWTQHANAPFSPRQYPAIATWDNRIWVVGGYDNTPGNTRDFFSTANGETWISHGNTPFSAGHADGLVGAPFGLVHATGNGTLIDGVRDVHVLQRAA